MAQVNYERLRELVRRICDEPGLRDRDYARQMGVDKRRVQRWLMLLEEHGVLLAEDKGQLIYISGIETFETAHQDDYDE